MVRGYCRDFARMHDDVPRYAALAGHFADDETALSLLDRATEGQARPVLLLAALHDLVLRRPQEPAARWFAPGPVGPGLWPDVRATMRTHRDELGEVIASRSTQTNEANRAAYLLPMLAAAAADLPEVPLGLVELGCSAGLLLNADRYRVRVGQRVTGPEDSPVRCDAEVVSGDPQVAIPPVAERAGVDLNPVRADDEDGLRWLRACLWPEQEGRVERFDAAVQVLRAHPPALLAGDMVDTLPAAVARVHAPGRHLVVYSSWAITYVDRGRRPRLLEVLGGTPGPVSLVTAEPPGVLDADGQDRLSGTEVWLRRWRDRAALPPVRLGTVGPHGGPIGWEVPAGSR